MNHKKAMPANGSSCRLRYTASRFAGSVTHVPASLDPAGTAHSVSTTDAANSSEKMSPATAAARGVLIALTATVTGAGVIVMSVRTNGLRRLWSSDSAGQNRRGGSLEVVS
jgi:hypothetical protein